MKLKTKLDNCNVFYKLSENRLFAYNTNKPLVAISVKLNEDNNHLDIFNTEPLSMESIMLQVNLQNQLESSPSNKLITKEQFIEEINKLVKQILRYDI